MVDQAEIHRMARSKDVKERRKAAFQLRSSFADLANKKLAWDDLHHLTFDNDIDVRRGTADALGSTFSHMPDKKQAFYDLIRLNSDTEKYVRRGATSALGNAFSHVPDKKQAWDDLIRLNSDTDSDVRFRAAYALKSAFSHVPDKKQAWDDLHRFTSDNDSGMRWGIAHALESAFSHVPDKKQAWDDLHRLTLDNDIIVRRTAAYTLGSEFFHLPDKEQAWNDLHRLTSDNERYVRWDTASALGSAFSHVPDKEQAWSDLHRLNSDNDNQVRRTANYSSGRVSIFRASEAESEDVFRKEMENALRFFEKASENATYDNPAKFCLPFYRSFYALTFKKEEAAADVQRYLSEAKNALRGSESKEKLLEAVENLGNALKEVQKARDFDSMKSDLNAYRRYCDRACELLDTTEEKAPGASRLIRRGLPIIDERIKGIIAEIQEKAKALCGETKNTTFRDAGIELNRIGQDFSQIRDPIGLEKSVNNMQIVLSAICAKMPEEERGEACTLLRQAKEEQYIEDKINLTNIVLGKISSQISAGKSMGKYIITNSQVQIAEREGIVQSMDSSKKPEKESGLFDFMNKSAIAATLSGFGTFVFSEIFDIFPPNYNKHVISVVLAIIIFIIILILTRTYYNK